jgi:hypothetical protein
VSGANGAKGETPLGDLAADALKQAAKADVALIPAGLLEEKDLPATAASPDAARSVFSFPTEQVVTIKVPGKQLLGALERSVALAPRKNQGFLQVAGLAFSYDSSKPDGGRISGVKANGDPLKLDKAYVVAMPESLAHGALGYFKFWDDKDAKPVTDKGSKVTLADALAMRLKAGKLPTKTDDRIKSK